MQTSSALALATVGALAGLLAAAALREAVLASPQAARWLAEAVDPFVRVGREGHVPTSLERRRLALLGTAVLLVCGWLVAGLPLAISLAVGGPVAASWAVSRRRARYRRAVERELPALAVALADALASGRSVRGAIGPAAGSLDGPIAAELARVVADLELGASTADAIDGFRRRLRSRRADAFAAALLSPRLGGGDMALLLRRYAAAASESDRLGEDARAATAQARFTGLLVVAMPTGGAIFGELVHPGFIGSMLASPGAAALLIAAAAMQLLGFAAIRRLSSIPG